MKDAAIDPLEQHPCTVDSSTATIRPQTPRGDDFYGLAYGTNGTAAIFRRALVELNISGGVPLRWVRANGKPAAGVNYVPTENSNLIHTDPWSGEVQS